MTEERLRMCDKFLPFVEVWWRFLQSSFAPLRPSSRLVFQNASQCDAVRCSWSLLISSLTFSTATADSYVHFTRISFHPCFADMTIWRSIMESYLGSFIRSKRSWINFFRQQTSNLVCRRSSAICWLAGEIQFMSFVMKYATLIVETFMVVVVHFSHWFSRFSIDDFTSPHSSRNISSHHPRVWIIGIPVHGDWLELLPIMWNSNEGLFAKIIKAFGRDLMMV